MSGAYWGLCTLEILKAGDRMNKEELVSWVVKCQNEDGGFGGNLGHDSTLVLFLLRGFINRYTLSALQILAICDKMDAIDKERVVAFIMSLYLPNGSFMNDKYGELDLRFNYCAVQSMCLLGRMSDLNVDQITKYICSCQNIDGGFGSIPGSESHSGMVFCAIGALSILHTVNRCNVKRLCRWLDYRQVDSGGLNGRPEKQCDLCYCWWSLSAMIILSRDLICFEQ